MNERVNDLMNQALPMIDWDARHYAELNNGEKNKFYADWFDNFARLLVKECIEKAEEEAERYLGFPNLVNADMYAKVMYNYQELLKEHFGLDEQKGAS